MHWIDPDSLPETRGIVKGFLLNPHGELDGIVDEQDSCPNEPGIAELKGCPAKDSDNDGVPDHLDNCPTEAGPADNQGCPAKQKQQVAIQSGRIQLKDTVYFDTA